MDSYHDHHEWNATFRLKREYRKIGLGGVLVWLAFTFVGVYGALTEPRAPHRVAAVAFMGGITLAFTALSAWLLAAYYRERLTICGTRITKQGVFRRIEFDLRDVTEARWGGKIVLRTAERRVPIEFITFERDERIQMIDHLRSVINPGVQTNWNLFDYKIAAPLRRPKPTKPGPDEILLRRNRWDRYLVPSVAVTAIVAVASWWVTGELRVFVMPVAPILMLVMMRMATPAEGMITHKLSFSADTELSRWLLFLLLWLMVALGGGITVEALRPRLKHPDTVLVIGLIVWYSGVFVEAFRYDRRQSRRDREAADLAAKERGEDRLDAPLMPNDDHWSM